MTKKISYLLKTEIKLEEKKSLMKKALKMTTQYTKDGDLMTYEK